MAFMPIPNPERTKTVDEKKTVSFKVACDFVMPFGKYKGARLAEVGRTDDGLTYLVWFANLSDLRPDSRAAIDAYMGNAQVAKLVEAAVDRDRAKR
jgi:uncharacterized protein (DUF3820 family)